MRGRFGAERKRGRVGGKGGALGSNGSLGGGVQGGVPEVDVLALEKPSHELEGNFFFNRD